MKVLVVQSVGPVQHYGMLNDGIKVELCIAELPQGTVVRKITPLHVNEDEAGLLEAALKECESIAETKADT